MIPEERRRTIVDIVTNRGGCSVEYLAEELSFSKATIRRDLRELESDGLLERSHGGAVPVTSVGEEQTYDEKEIRNIDAKRAIAEVAVEEVEDGEVVFFDAGTTTMQVAKALSTEDPLLAVTSSPRLAIELTDENNEVKLTGGTLRRRTRALVGPTAESFMERMNFDLLFLGTNAIHPDNGLSTPNEDEARMKELMVEKAARVVLVADGSKMGKRSLVKFADIGDVDRFVTDETVPRDLAQALSSTDVDVTEGLLE